MPLEKYLREEVHYAPSLPSIVSLEVSYVSNDDCFAAFAN